MKAEGSRFANRTAGAVLAALATGFLTSCTATSGPDLEMASPAYNSSGIAAVMAEVAQAEAASAGAADETATNVDHSDELPDQVAVAPTLDPRASASSDATAEIAENGAAEAAVESSTEAAQADLPAEEADEESGALVALKTEPKKRGFLASFFSPAPAAGAAAPGQAAFAPTHAQAAKPLIEPEAKEEAAPLVDLEAKKERLVTQASFGDDALPGVRKVTSLFEITHKSGAGDDGTIDLYEDVDAPLVLASAAGLARLAPNGLLKQRESVDVACLKPSLVRILKTVERHFGKRMVVTSGYRSPEHNRRVRGAKRSQHMFCAAADVQVPGVSKWELAKFVRSLPGRGGVGTYCHTKSVHIDVGPERDWNWRCRKS